MKNYSVKNPLSIIAIFSTITEGLCVCVLPQLSTANQDIFIRFVIGFPTLLVVAFFATLNFNHKVLYAPSDFDGANTDLANLFYGKHKFEGGEKSTSALKHETRVFSQDTTITNTKNNYIDKFISNSSIIGIYGLYAVSLSHTNSKPFNINDLRSKISILAGEYTIGYLISASSFGFFSRSSYSDDWEVLNFDRYLSEKIKEAAYAQAEQEKREKVSEYLYGQLNLIEMYFEANTEQQS